jgi:pimeloyl-ACP methyl ester carboxylesterase
VQQKVPAAEVILVGESLGAGTAVELATRRDNRLLLTLSAFTSVPDMARLAFPWLPLRWFVRNRFDNLRKLPAVRGPVFLTHGTDDRVVPFAHGQLLAEAAPPPSRFLALPGVGHNVLLAVRNDRFWSEVRAFIDETRRPQR